MTKELERMYYLLTAMVENGVTPNNSTSTLERELYYKLIEAILHNSPNITIDRKNDLESNVLKNSGTNVVDANTKYGMDGATKQFC